MDSPADYCFGGDLWNCPNPQRLAVLYGTAMGWTDVVPQGHLTTGIGINVSYVGADGTTGYRCLGASFLQDFAAGRFGPGVPTWSQETDPPWPPVRLSQAQTALRQYEAEQDAQDAADRTARLNPSSTERKESHGSHQS